MSSIECKRTAGVATSTSSSKIDGALAPARFASTARARFFVYIETLQVATELHVVLITEMIQSLLFLLYIFHRLGHKLTTPQPILLRVLCILPLAALWINPRFLPFCHHFVPTLSLSDPSKFDRSKFRQKRKFL